MKLRLGLILSLFVASAVILVWLYYAATREPRTPKSSPWTETLADLDACCRRKHVKSAQYDHFANIAAGEERREAERLFRAMAFSQRLQENNCATAIGLFNSVINIILLITANFISRKVSATSLW